ncbi:uncharacterized protein LOC132858889 [Tachysurus vachellii]|uniref:uncharacterized protein LOC132858889 n=1 Tax=Tachysurus vachellii TaxID=175792 RepID=UPI00296A9E03|nr:uncharacterized protein LOC132858889 [Tachysurus vachellii]
MFHIVSFLETNEVEVVPSGWVDGDQCVWPHLRGESLTKAVKLAMKPKKEWKICKVKLLYTTDNYDDARKKLPEAELFSDIQSDTESGVKKPRRIIFAKGDIDKTRNDSRPAKYNYENPTVNTSPKFRDRLPVKDVESLQCLEAELKMNPDSKSELTTYLGLVGGFDLKDTVWRVLKATFTTAVAHGMNWRGVNGKIGVQRLVITEVVIGAVRQNPLSAKASNKEIETNIIKWLHLAGDREGGRRERMNKREAQQNTADPH